IAYGWESDGTLSVTTVVTNVSSPVIGIPGAIAHYVAGRSFRAMTEDNTATGTIALDERGASWGYGPFLRRRGAEPGDVLSVRFDLSTDGAILSLGNEAALDEPE